TPAMGAVVASPRSDEAPDQPPAAAPPAASTSRPRPPRRRGSGPLGLELRFMWGDRMVGEYLLKPREARSFSVGSAAGVDFIMGDAKLPGGKLDVVRSDEHGFTLRFTGKMDGELHRDGKVIGLKEAIESGKAHHDGDAYQLALEPNDFAWVDLGSVTLEVCFQPMPKPVFVPFLETVDFTVLNIFLVMFFLAALFIISALNRELEGEGYVDELAGNQARIV